MENLFMVDRVLQLLAESGIKTSPLEKQLGFTRGTIEKWRKGKNKVSTEAIIKIATYFNVSADYLLCLSDIPKPLKISDIAERKIAALSTEIAELSQDERFVNSAKLYKELPNKYREEVYALIRGIAIGFGLNVQQILER